MVYRSAFRFRALLAVTVSIRQFRHSLSDHAEHIRKIRDALVGGFTAELLFEILKKSFGYYVTALPTYETIYGAFATFPIFLIWMYISWLVVLLGAELCATMPEWRNGQRSPATIQPENPATGYATPWLCCMPYQWRARLAKDYRPPCSQNWPVLQSQIFIVY